MEVNDVMGIIRMECNDKTLAIIDAPAISIGGANSIEISFCSKWDSYEKTILFYSEDAECHRVAIQGSTASIPSEVLSEGASFFFFIEGTKGEERRRSHVFKGKIESSSIIAENPDSDVLIRIIDLIENMDKSFDYDDLSEEDKADLRADISTINAQYTSTYNVAGLTSRIPINIAEYKHGTDILEVYINGMRLIEGDEYSNDGTSISLMKPLDTIGQVHIAVTKSIALTTRDWEALQGEEIEAISNLEIDKLMGRM